MPPMLNTLKSDIAPVHRSIYWLFILFCSLFNLSGVYAEGSKDLYPNGATGARACMYATATTTNHPSFPFKTRGTHYVFVQAGEWICVGSSNKGMSYTDQNGVTWKGGIRLIPPNGLPAIVSTTNTGRILSRSQELVGPNGPNQGSGPGYTPLNHKVLPNEAGIWRIEFSVGNDPGSGGPDADNISADEDWTQTASNRFILAWDISVRNVSDNGFVAGRVYANVLNLGIAGEFNNPNRSYHGKNYVLTKDGRAYYVSNNGNNGYGFTFFANNKGLVDPSGASLYKSLNFSDQAIINYVQDPRAQDNAVKNLITHKLFYNAPAPDLPADAPVCIEGNSVISTWLKREAIVPVTTDVKFTGAEGTLNQSGQKGGYITFNANVQGSYRIVIPIPNRASRVLTGSAGQGPNTIKWDGRDGSGVLVPANTIIPEVRVRLTSAEVHFPFLDMEINPKGIIIELTKNEPEYGIDRTSLNESVYSDRVYWDDSDITSADTEKPNPIINTTDGRPSTDNGHIWSSYSGGNGNSYGNGKAMDTWAYMLSDDAATPLNVAVKVADLKIASITTEANGQNAGNEIIYRIKVENVGPSDVSGAKFALALPAGINVTNVSFSTIGPCGQESNRALNGQLLTSELNLSKDCVVEYVIKATITADISVGGLHLEASIMRPNDVTDPDASNQTFETPPTDPHEECENGMGTENCNNIRYNAIKTLEFCAGSPITPFSYDLAAGGTNYTVDGLPAWLIPTYANGKVTFAGTPDTHGSFYFTVGTAGNEREKTTFLIEINPVPVIASQPVAITVCSGTDALFSVESGATDTYQWQYEEAGVWKNFVDGGNIIGAATATLKISATSSNDNGKKIKVVITSAMGCSTISNEIAVTVHPLPSAPTLSANGAPTAFCEGGSVLLTSSSSTGNQWYRDGSLLTGETGQTYRANTIGKYTVITTNANGCSSMVSNDIQVTVNSLPQTPVVTPTTNTTFCAGSSVVLTSSSMTGNQWYKEGQPIQGATESSYTAITSGDYTVMVTNSNDCQSSMSRPVPVTTVLFPETPTISPAGATTFCEGGIVTLTSSSAAGNQWYKNGNLIPGATNQTLDVNQIGIYTVKVTNATGCVSAISALTNVTVKRVPKGYADLVNTLSCTQSSFSYSLQANVNNTAKGGNSVPASFSWTASSNLVTGVASGSGKTMNATLINISATVQDVVYTVTPKAESGGCAGQPFQITVRVPACVNISISKTADKSSVAAPGDKINYTIIVHNNGNANHNQVKVNDPLLGGFLDRPAGDNGNGILEKDETWTYRGTYTITQSDLDNNGVPLAATGKVLNTATVSSLEFPLSKSATAEVAIQANPSLTLVKTGAMNRGFTTMTYTFNITNNGNVTLKNVTVKDPKIPQPIVLKQTVLVPGASTTGQAIYTITNEEKIAGSVSNTAKAEGLSNTGTKAVDISGSTENNDDPTVIDITRYPIAIDDFAKTKADEEVMVPVINNDRPALFPLNAATLEVRSQPTNGVLALNKDGKVVYRPNKGFFGVEKFSYKVDDANGLSSNIAQVRIDVAPPPLDIPNTFTPNGDGKNDAFQITGMENYDAVSIFVYNRWGDEVYRSINYKNEWNGNGLNDGTYFYVLKLKKGKSEESRRSWVLIKR